MNLQNFAITVFMVCFSGAAVTAPKYDSTDNTVTIRDTVGPNSKGFIVIRSEDHIEVFMYGYDRTTGKMVLLCANEPSLGLLIVNGRSGPTLAPEVSEVVEVSDAKGWAASYVLKGDSAYELIDIMYENESVGFVTSNNDCPSARNDGDVTTGRIMSEWETNGLERVMKRMN